MTNVVVPESGVFTNADGLRVKYGVAEARKGVAGTVALKDDTRKLYYDIDWNRLPAFSTDGTGNLYGSEPEDALPTGAVINTATLIVGTAFVGTNAHLTIGFVDRAGQNGATNGILDDEAVASLSANAVISCTGSQVATTPTTIPMYLWVEVDTATFTAGNARLEIDYFIPRVAFP